jgi:hypothetical protein
MASSQRSALLREQAVTNSDIASDETTARRNSSRPTLITGSAVHVRCRSMLSLTSKGCMGCTTSNRATSSSSKIYCSGSPTSLLALPYA